MINLWRVLAVGTYWMSWIFSKGQMLALSCLELMTGWICTTSSRTPSKHLYPERSIIWLWKQRRRRLSRKSLHFGNQWRIQRQALSSSLFKKSSMPSKNTKVPRLRQSLTIKSFPVAYNSRTWERTIPESYHSPIHLRNWWILLIGIFSKVLSHDIQFHPIFYCICR